MSQPLDSHRLVTHLQCVRRLWLEAQPQSSTRHPLAREVRRDESDRVKQLAQQLYPGGVVVPRTPHAEARTLELLADPDVPAIFGAVIHAGGVRVIIDILARYGHAFDLVDVHSGLKVKRGHELDAAVVASIVRGAGLPVRKVLVIHVRRAQKALCVSPQTHLRVVDISDRLPAVEPFDVQAVVDAMQAKNEPDVTIGPHCVSPWRCPFMAHCAAPAAQHFAKPPRVALRAAERGEAYVDAEVVAAMPAGPVYTLDFEAFSTSLPQDERIAPFEAVPFLWVACASDSPQSLHFMGKQIDPRLQFVTSLLDALAGPRPVLVWSDYEAKTLGRLAKLFPEHAAGIDQLRERIVDLHVPVRSGYYSPALGGMYSVKAVAGALAPGFSYDDLAIDNGRDAALLGLGLRRDLVPDTVAEQLVRYCERDAQALIAIYNALRSATPSEPEPSEPEPSEPTTAP